MLSDGGADIERSGRPSVHSEDTEASDGAAATILGASEASDWLCMAAGCGMIGVGLSVWMESVW